MSSNQSEPLPKVITFASAGAGGLIGWTIVHPLNTLSVRRNLSMARVIDVNIKMKNNSLKDFISNIIRQEGFGAFYKGITAGWTRQIFYSTSVFGFFEVFRDIIAKDRELDYLSRLMAGVGS